MATSKIKTAKKPSRTADFDGVYLLKLMLYVIVGSLWLKINRHDTLNLPIPVGLAIGLIFSSHEHFRIDRKIEYAVLLVAMLVGYIAPYGLYISF
jgi:hypothetical protein